MTSQRKPPAAPKRPTAMDLMIEACVKKSKARKRSGQSDREWRQLYSQSLKVGGAPAPMSETPFDGDTTKKKH